MNVSTTLTPGQRFAAEYGSKAVEEMLKTIAWTKRLALGIVAAVMAVSFQHQRHYLLGIRMDQFGAAVIPLVIDALTIVCVKVLSTTGMHRTAKVLALVFLAIPVVASGYINFVGSPNIAVGIVYLIAVACIPVAETIKAFIRPDFMSILAEEDRIQPAAKVGRKGKRCEPGCTCGKHSSSKRRRRSARTPKAPAAAPVSPGVGPVGEYVGRKA
jgi:hypothetical protein